MLKDRSHIVRMVVFLDLFLMVSKTIHAFSMEGVKSGEKGVANETIRKAFNAMSEYHDLPQIEIMNFFDLSKITFKHNKTYGDITEFFSNGANYMQENFLCVKFNHNTSSMLLWNVLSDLPASDDEIDSFKAFMNFPE